MVRFKRNSRDATLDESLPGNYGVKSTPSGKFSGKPQVPHCFEKIPPGAPQK